MYYKGKIPRQSKSDGRNMNRTSKLVTLEINKKNLFGPHTMKYLRQSPILHITNAKHTLNLSDMKGH